MSLSLPEEQQLVERAQQGDEQAYEKLILAFSAPLYRVVRRLVSDPLEAEGVVQEAFWRTWRSLPRYKNDRPFFPYLVTVALNLQRDKWRSERRIEERDVEEALNAATDPRPNPEARLEKKEDLARLSQAIERLPIEYREVIALRYDAEMSYEEIAATLNIPINTIKTHLHRAKQLLRRFMEDYNG